MYQTLYRKYRPSNFDEVVGQKVIVKTLKNAIINDKLSHAYLFTGPRGTGKTSIAKILAKTINCENINDYLPCDKCNNCLQNSKNPIDILEIDAASNNGVDEIRELKNKINLVPSMGKYKVYIIDEVHMLSTGAFNALLKTLEEPPKHVLFILATTDSHKVPTTILSRCQRFDFKKISVEEIVSRMKYIKAQEKITISDEALIEIANLSDGGMRDALSLLDQAISYADEEIKIEDIHEINGTITKKEIIELITLMLDNNLEKIFSKIDDYNTKGKDFIKLDEEIIESLRNILLKINVPNIYNEKISCQIEDEILNKFDNNLIMNYIREFNGAISEMKNSNNPRILFELVIIKLMNIKNNIELNQNTNLDKIINIRVNNTLCNFNKKELLSFNDRLIELKKYELETKYSEYISLILDSKLKAVGDKYMIFVVENDKFVDTYNSNIEVIDELFYKTYKIKYKTIAVDKTDWENIKKEFNNKKKEYKFISE